MPLQVITHTILEIGHDSRNGPFFRCSCSFTCFAVTDVEDARGKAAGHAAQPYFLRPGEVLLWVKRPPTPDGPICSKHGSLVEAMYGWDHCITNHHFPNGDHVPGDTTFNSDFKIGEDRFSLLRPANGEEPCGGSDYKGTYRPGSSCWPMPRCPKCGLVNSTKTQQQAYGDLTTCRTPGCDFSNWCDIGD